MRVTYVLSSAEEAKSQHIKKGQRATVTHFLCHSLWREGGGYKSVLRKKASSPRALTSCRAQTEGQIRTDKGKERAGGTHELSSEEVGKSQNSERKRANERARGTHGL